ncbi:MAG: aldehyde dehydrogenase family protein [Pseudomonadota bacterium]
MKIDLLIDGERCAPSGGEYDPLTGPATPDILASVARATAADVDRAAEAASAAFERGRIAAVDRSAIMLNASQLVLAQAEELANLLVLEVGKTLREARGEVKTAADAFSTNAAEALRVRGVTLDGDAAPQTRDFEISVLREPAGPVCAMTAFNAPLNQVCYKVGMAFAAGCPVVVKPSPFTPMVTSRAIDLLVEAGMPKGWIHLVTGGVEVGQALFESPDFARYAFTGSRNVGDILVRSVGLRRSLLELGSNGPNIVHRDADLPLAAKTITASGFAIAGQVCMRPQRVLVQEDVLDAFAEHLLQRVGALRVGDPREADTDMGPVRTADSAARIVDWVKQAENRGAKVLTGGTHEGCYVAPTVISGVRSDDLVACEEIFGPVLVLQTYGALEEAFREANASKYGLQAAIFTTNLETARLARRGLRAGGVVINNASRMRTALVPFGGAKASGLGREGGPWGVEEFTEVKVVYEYFGT